MDFCSVVVDAFAELGLRAAAPASPSGSAVDLILDVNGAPTQLQLKRRALVDGGAARAMLKHRGPASALLVVGDRVTQEARTVLTVPGSGYLDLRGRLALRTDGVVIDAPVQSLTARSARKDALAGSVGLQVAVALLMRPHRPVAIRELARSLGRSPSTVSEVLAALRADGHVDGRNVVDGTDLFWRLADRWATPRTTLATMPLPGTDPDPFQPLGLRLDAKDEAGWAMTDSVAAAFYGAPVAVAPGNVHDFFVPSTVALRRAVTLLGAAASPSDARCTVRVAPVPAACAPRIDRPGTEWLLSNPLFVALDLAQDAGRGREVLEAWTPDGWPRVW